MTPETGLASEFPHRHHVKVIGQHSDLLTAVREAVASHAQALPENAFTLRPSSQGQYHSVTVSLEVHSEAQLLAIYTAVKAIDGVILCL